MLLIYPSISLLIAIPTVLCGCALDALAFLVQSMTIDRSDSHAFVAEQFLCGAEVANAFWFDLDQIYFQPPPAWTSFP